MISNRAKKFISSPSAIMEGYFKCLEDPFSEKNTSGYLNFGIAENYLNDDLLLPKLNQPLNIKADQIQYSSINGDEEVRVLLQKFFESYLGLKNVKPENIVINNGLTSICESMSFTFFDEGDKILIPTPYYTGFEHDFTKRFACEFVPVHLNPAEDFVHKIEYFEQAFIANPNAKAVLITHPHNPTGEILNEEFMLAIIDFCLTHNLQLISDEIYALSTHLGQKHKSLFQLASDKGVKAHFLYGMAKDFCLAGLKVGFYYSHDDEAVQGMHAGSYFYPISSPSFLHLKNIFSDQSFLDSYLSKNQKRLNETKNKIIKELPSLSFIPAPAAVFMLLDLSQYCETFEEELSLFQKLLDKHKINLTPGKAMGTKHPGYFRVCFTRKNPQIDEFISRMQQVKTLL